MSERPLITVGGLVVAADGEILLVQSKKWNNLYALPGGKVERGESREQAFIREIEEETQLRVINPCFIGVQECIFSEEFWQKQHLVMHDFIADLDSNYKKEDVQLNHEAYHFIWVLPQQALKMSLQRECRLLIQWYLTHRLFKKEMTIGLLGIHQHPVRCIIGVLPEERQYQQTLMIDAKIKVDLSSCLVSDRLGDTVNYVLIAQICTELAYKKKYFLLETLASDILDECLQRLQANWAWICIQKPSALTGAAYAYVELERFQAKE